MLYYLVPVICNKILHDESIHYNLHISSNIQALVSIPTAVARHWSLPHYTHK